MARLCRMLSIAAVILLGVATDSSARVVYHVEPFTSDGSPLTAATRGEQLVLDITVRTVGDFAVSVAGSVNDYDSAILDFDLGATRIAGYVFAPACPAPLDCTTAGLVNQITRAPIVMAERRWDPGVEVEFLASLSLSPATGDGSADRGVVTDRVGDPQFRVVFDLVGLGATTLRIGTYPEYLDGYRGTVDSLAENVSVFLNVVPEPGTGLLLIVGLALLAARRA